LGTLVVEQRLLLSAIGFVADLVDARVLGRPILGQFDARGLGVLPQLGRILLPRLDDHVGDAFIGHLSRDG
jgi:hypothetical protein